MRVSMEFTISDAGVMRSGQHINEYIEDKRIETFAEYVMPVLDKGVKFHRIEDHDMMHFSGDVYVFTESEMHEIITMLNKSKQTHEVIKAKELLRY